MKKNITLGVIIILIGILWLLSNLNVFSFSIGSFFLALRSLWPLLLVGIGLSILLKENHVLRSIVWLLIFLAVLLYGIFGINNGLSMKYGYQLPSNYTENHNYNLSKQEKTEQGQLNMTLGAGEIRLSSTDDNLVQLKSNIPELQYEHKLENSEQKVIMDISKRDYVFNARNNHMFCYLELHEDVTWDMDLKLGAAKADLNLTDLIVGDLNLDVGAADLKLSLGGKSSLGEIEINAGASNVEIYLPKDAGIRIKLESALSSNNIESLGLVKKDDFFESPDFEGKTSKYILTVKMGVGNLKFHTL